MAPCDSGSPYYHFVIYLYPNCHLNLYPNYHLSLSKLSQIFAPKYKKISSTTLLHFSVPFISGLLCRVQCSLYFPSALSGSVLHGALKLNVTRKKGQKRPNVAILVGNSADVACGVRKGLVRSVVLWRRPTHSQATAADFAAR